MPALDQLLSRAVRQIFHIDPGVVSTIAVLYNVNRVDRYNSVVSALVKNLRLKMSYKCCRVLIFNKFDRYVPVHQVIVHQIDGAEHAQADKIARGVLSQGLSGYKLHCYCSRKARQATSTARRCISSQ